MYNYFERNLANAILECDGMYVKDFDSCQGFSKIYPFTTENISGYINKFDLNGKSF